MLKTYYKVIFFCGISFFVSHATVSVVNHGREITVYSEYGMFKVHEPIVVDLINSKSFERLKYIHQYGVCCYAKPDSDFSRWEHSVGVFALLRRFGAGLEEQVAGLLHDVSHTVFSHVGDVVFGHYFDRYSYQDSIHEWYLKKSGLSDILTHHGCAECCTEKTKKRQRMLEQDKPDICADRIDYLLRGGLKQGFLSQDDVDFVLRHLYFERGEWFFDDCKAARTLAYSALTLSNEIFGDHWNAFIYNNACDALKKALDLGVVSFDEIHFSTDDVVWKKLLACSDNTIQKAVEKIIHYAQFYVVADSSNYTMHVKGKFLGIDPWVKTDVGLARLSALDSQFAHDYASSQATINQGWYIKVLA